MTEKADQAERLLDELETLKQLLDNPIDDKSPLQKHDLETIEGIPVLNDQITTFTTEQPPLIDDELRDFEAPLSDERIQKMIDELVAEHLPILEKKLRERLLEALSLEI